MAGIDITAAMQSFTQIYNKINNIANQTVGMNVEWMRAIPQENSEDVIFHEYTLHNVECPQTLKVVTSNTSYNPGNFSVDYFGINYEAPLEISMDTQTWEDVYGSDSMPQQKDIVYVDLMNCLYEVASSTVEYGFAAQATGYKIQLTKWNPRANVRLNQSVEETINDLTTGEAELFGQAIANDVADIVDEPQTSELVSSSDQNNDKFKNVDMDSVQIGDIKCKDNIIAKSYYDMRYITQSIFYKNGDNYQASSNDNYRFFSCWFKLTGEEETISVNKLSTDKGKYYLDSNTKGLIDGGEIEISRGAYLHAHAVTNKVVMSGGSTRWMITFNNSEFKDMTKKITNWNNNLTLTKSNSHPLLMGRNEGKCNFNISIIGTNTLLIKFGKKIKRVAFDELPKDLWCCVAVNLGPESDAYVFTKDSEWNLEEKVHLELGDMVNSFDVGEFYIPQSETMLTNIRYYKTSEKSDNNQVIKDLTWMLAKNDSKSIVNDGANIPNTSPFITEQR